MLCKTFTRGSSFTHNAARDQHIGLREYPGSADIGSRPAFAPEQGERWDMASRLRRAVQPACVVAARVQCRQPRCAWGHAACAMAGRAVNAGGPPGLIRGYAPPAAGAVSI